MQKTGMSDQPRSELRHDPVQKRWVIVASARGLRPNDFKAFERSQTPADSCPLCGGRESLTPPTIASYRLPNDSSGSSWHVRVVPNKYPALRVEGELGRSAEGNYDRMDGIGAHEVVVETPSHDVRLEDLSVEHLALVLAAYRERIADLMKDRRLRYVLVFKNSGAGAGASLSHSHSQIMATPITPRTVAMELDSARAHYQAKERCIFCDILRQELSGGERVVVVDQFFVTHCPYASRFPFEMHLHPRAHHHDYASLNDDYLLKLAHHLKEVLLRMKTALNDPPYNFLLHTAPSTIGRTPRRSYWDTLDADWHWHIEILPRITKTAGFEWGTGFYINPTPPEEAARCLRQVDL
jgi:UDPglucose--hexose-1-phosphate uridylyltransferase